MISTTIVAEVVTADGTAAWPDPWEGPGYRTFQATPPDTFDTWQPGRIGVSIGHDGPIIGHVDYLETGLGYGDAGLFAVGVIEAIPASVLDGQVMCSPEITADAIATTIGRGRDARSVGDMHATTATLTSIALVGETAGVGARPVRAWHGDYRPVGRPWPLEPTPPPHDPRPGSRSGDVEPALQPARPTADPPPVRAAVRQARRQPRRLRDRVLGAIRRRRPRRQVSMTNYRGDPD